MSNNHGLTLTQSEMQEIISICEKESDTLTQYKETLRDIVKYTDEMEVAKTDFDYNISSAERKLSISKAKQLLN